MLVIAQANVTPFVSPRNGVLHGKKICQEEIKYQVVLPADPQGEALKAAHDLMDHPGRDRKNSLLQGRFYWPGMLKESGSYVANCGMCIRQKTVSAMAPLVNIVTTEPLELVCINYLSLPI